MELFGSISLGALGLLEYQMIQGDSQVGTDTGSAQFATEVSPEPLAELDKITIDGCLAGRLSWTPPLPGLRFNWTASDVPATIYGKIYFPDSPTGMTTLIMKYSTSVRNILSIDYTYENFKFVAEWFIYSGRTVLYLPDLGAPPTHRLKHSDESYYVSLGYRFNDWFEASTYYSHHVDDEDNGRWLYRTRSAGLNCPRR